MITTTTTATAAAVAFVAATHEGGGATIIPATGELLAVGNGGPETFWIVGVRMDATGARIAGEFWYLADLSPEVVDGFVSRVKANTDGATDATAGSWVLDDPTREARQEAARRRADLTGVAHVDNPDTDGPIVVLDHGGRYPLIQAIATARAANEESIFGPANFSTVYTGLNNAGDVVNHLDNADTTLATTFGRELAASPVPFAGGPVARYVHAARVARATLAGDADSRTLAVSAEYIAQGMARAAA